MIYCQFTLSSLPNQGDICHKIAPPFIYMIKPIYLNVEGYFMEIEPYEFSYCTQNCQNWFVSAKLIKIESFEGHQRLLPKTVD